MGGHGEMISPVRITDKDGNSAAVVFDPVTGLYRLEVNATLGGAIPIPLPIALGGNTQVQNIERAIAALGVGTWNGTTRDCANYADFAVSVYAARVAADTTLDVVIECSLDGATWREVDRQVLTLSATVLTTNLNRNYTCTRRYMRVSVVNNTAAANVEVVSNMKPIG